MPKRKLKSTIGINPLETLKDSSFEAFESTVSQAQVVEPNTSMVQSAISPPVVICATKIRGKTVNELFNRELSGRAKPVAFQSKSEKKAFKIIRTSSQWSVVVGMIPVPLVDAALISLAQVRMMQLLSRCYNVPFEKNAALAVIGALMGGGGGTVVAQLAGRAALKTLPVAGPLMSFVAEPALGYATTFALGKTFLEHLKGGGTLQDFDASKMKVYFQMQSSAAKKYFISMMPRKT
jgi:uncharacterized protein (DUF697 family)